MHLRGFGEGAALPLGDELRAAHEIIVTSVNFAGPGAPGSATHGVAQILTASQERLGDGRFSPAAGSAEDDREAAHSRFSTCSRMRSNSSLIRSTSVRMAE